ncbi:hypothetical protein [Segetibacter koreensis]|uniref:hypothetical protein n=1 Tax=Segetibacter koreensis TaxID=398037 RepID=UPI000361C6EA|nr:hypothetical protein [Segetibacter koreensis]
MRNLKLNVPISPIDFKNKRYTLSINWENVHFYNDKISFKICDKYFSNKFFFKGCKESYNYLKKYFFRKQLYSLIVDFEYENPIRVQNVDQLNNMLEILAIESYIYFECNSASLGQAIRLSKLNLKKQVVCNIYKLYKKSVYFDLLIDVHDDKFKVVPVPEVILNEKGNIVQMESSFLFAINKGDFINIIWESVVEKKATYIFTCAKRDYDTQLQKIFDYITSPKIRNKRQLIMSSTKEHYSKELMEILQLNQRLEHQIPKQWIKIIIGL